MEDAAVSWPLQYPVICLEILSKIWKSSVRAADVSAKIQNEHLPNLQRYTSLLAQYNNAST